MEVVQQCNREIGALEGNVRSGEARLVEDTRAAESEKELRVAYRREALSLATATAFETAAREVISKLIEPIAAEVRARWQQLFPLEGLTLRPDGTVVRILGNHTLEWDTLSGGERVWARIVTHLLVLASATRLPFVWFDEPLEHLDPQLRRVVAATLATTTRHGYPRQLLVTTYEDAIARQLAEDTGTARIVAVRAAGPVPRLPNRPPQREASRNSRARRAS
jgi:ABC-type hemin transport system ATPase subunit